MITRAQAVQLVAVFRATLDDRCTAFINAAARAGQTSGVFTYAPADDPNIDAYITQLTGAGWTVVKDAINRTLTIS